MEYQPLDTDKNEIRLLYPAEGWNKEGLPGPEDDTLDMIQLEMKNVSLADFTAESQTLINAEGCATYSGVEYLIHMSKVDDGASIHLTQKKKEKSTPKPIAQLVTNAFHLRILVDDRVVTLRYFHTFGEMTKTPSVIKGATMSIGRNL
jgi:hypothetical protein